MNLFLKRIAIGLLGLTITGACAYGQSASGRRGVIQPIPVQPPQAANQQRLPAQPVKLSSSGRGKVEASPQLARPAQTRPTATPVNIDTAQTMVVAVRTPDPPGDSPVATPLTEAVAATPLTETRMQTTRYLLVRNQTGERITVRLQFYVPTEDGQGTWLPATPAPTGEDSKALECELAAGAETYFAYGNNRVAGSRVRIWAESDASIWDKYRHTDLMLVPELAKDGTRSYSAADVGTFAYTFKFGSLN